MSNPVSRWVNNTFTAAENVDRAANVNMASYEAKKTLADKEKAKKLAPNEKTDLQAVAKIKPKAEEAVKNARGQFFGALLQNRTYDSKGQIVGTQKDHAVTKVDRKTGKASK
jgi:hypothetical protein